jgi:hypothetical protein
MGLITGMLRKRTGWGVAVTALISSALLVVSVLKGSADIAIPFPPRLLLEAKVTFAPKALPRSGREPIALHLESRVSAEGEHPPALREAQLDLDKHVEIDAEDFSACPVGVAAHDAYARALQSCADAVVGVGEARIEVVDPESGALRDASSRLTIFKGGVRGGTTTLLFRLGPSAPLRSPLLAIAKSRALERGRFGTQMTIAFPRIAEGKGSIVSLDFGLRRRAPGEGSAGVVRAGCADGHLTFRLTGIFVDGSKLTTSSFRACTAAP